MSPQAARRPMTPEAKQAMLDKRAATMAAKEGRAAMEEAEARAGAPVRRSNPRPAPAREASRDIARENARPGAEVAVGRDGERLTRRRIATGDKLHVPPNEIPRGWDYQWNAVTVLNQNVREVQGDLEMYENGWRPVPASRHPGRWTPYGFEGAIIIDGLRLEERPKSLSEEARAEDTARAKAQVRDRTDALKMTQAQLPGARVAQERNRAGGVNIDFNDRGADIPRPQHELDTDRFEE